MKHIGLDCLHGPCPDPNLQNHGLSSKTQLPPPHHRTDLRTLASPPWPPPSPVPATSEEISDVRKLPTEHESSTFDPPAPPGTASGASSLTLADAAELHSLLLRRLGIPSAPPIAILNSAGGLGGAGQAGENAATVFELRLEAFDAASKIKVIRSFTDLGLKELMEKELTVIKGGESKQEAEVIVERMNTVGAKVVVD